MVLSIYGLQEEITLSEFFKSTDIKPLCRLSFSVKLDFL